MDKEGMEWLGPEFRASLSTQRYGSAIEIDGAKRFDLPYFPEDGGDLTEIARLNDEGSLRLLPGFRPKQINHSVLQPGTIKAWHVHSRQDDVWFLPATTRLLVGLYDVRAATSTPKIVNRFVSGGGSPQLLFVPRGVAHGVANLGSVTASIVYLVNNTFQPEDPDEHRLPWDILGADFWRAIPG